MQDVLLISGGARWDTGVTTSGRSAVSRDGPSDSSRSRGRQGDIVNDFGDAWDSLRQFGGFGLLFILVNKTAQLNDTVISGNCDVRELVNRRSIQAVRDSSANPSVIHNSP